MKQIDKKDFTKKTLLGGIVILLPVALLAMGFNWLFKFVTDLIQPLTNLVTNIIGLPEIFADLLVLIGMTAVCFGTGWLVTTAGGAWFHAKFDDRLVRYAPGYQILKDIVGQFFGDASKSPFANGEVALVKLFGTECPTEITAIVTSKHADGTYTIFMPTGPNPTSGNIYHVKQELVTLYPHVSVGDAMRTIIACGAGTGDLFSGTSGVGSEVRTKAASREAVSVGDQELSESEFEVSSKCRVFLKRYGLYSMEALATSSYGEVIHFEGFRPDFVKEIVSAIEKHTEDSGVLDGSDWYPVSRLDLDSKLVSKLTEAGLICLYELDEASKEPAKRLKEIAGIGPVAIARIQEAVAEARA